MCVKIRSRKTSEVHILNTRSSIHKFFVFFVRTNVRKYFIFYNGVKMWNNLSHDFFCVKSLCIFRCKLRFCMFATYV